MPSVVVERLTFGWADAAPILRDLSLRLEPGFTAIVGENGAGKSTFLELVAGRLRPASGRVRLEPAGARAVHCPQRVDEPSPAEAALAAADGGSARALRGRLRLDPATLGRWPTLSPGERRRWQIGAALHGDPAVLLLDEPTTHLDADGRSLLLHALRPFRGVCLVVSHDRALLEALSSRTLRLHRGEARLWPLPYDGAREAWEAEARAGRVALTAAQEEARRAARRLDEARRVRARAEASRSGARRDPRDRDARSMGVKNAAAWAEDRLGRQVARRVADLERRIAAVEGHAGTHETGRTVVADHSTCPRPWLLRIETCEVAAGGKTIARDVRLALGRHDRIRLAGPNGAGKSTLVAALLAASDVPAGRLLVLPQDLGAEDGARALEEVKALDPERRGKVLSRVAALGVDPARLLASRRPSPGEARQLLVAIGLELEAWGLLLDEPENHLDLPARERLEEALEDWPGALLLVTHDERIAARCTTAAWSLEDGRVVVR